MAVGLPCGLSKEPLGSVKDGNFPDKLIEYQILNKDCDLWS
jgi:hypothetical protein